MVHRPKTHFECELADLVTVCVESSLHPSLRQKSEQLDDATDKLTFSTVYRPSYL